MLITEKNQYDTAVCDQSNFLLKNAGSRSRGEYMSQKIWNCLTWKSGYFETVCPGQPENLQNCLSKHKSQHFLGNVEEYHQPNCLFYIFFDLKCRRASTYIFFHLFGPKLSITSKNFWNCLQVCLGSETVCPEKDRLFIHPCFCPDPDKVQNPVPYWSHWLCLGVCLRVYLYKDSALELPFLSLGRGCVFLKISRGCIMLSASPRALYNL